MKIQQALDVSLLEAHIQDGYVSRRTHPHLPLVIFNYTPKTQFEGLWDNVTRQCRGLVVDQSGTIVAHCLPKFFNYNEPNAAGIDTSGIVQVTDKLDGSYGCATFYKSHLVVATRGSFESVQAGWAYDKIKNCYYDAMRTLCQDGVTAIFEIIYPENRIVLDYDGLADIVLIGTIAPELKRDGRQIWTPADKVYSWPGPTVHRFEVSSFEAALRLPVRQNAEGLVIYFENTGERLKIKHDDYLRLHKIIFSLTPKLIWSRLAAGESTEEIVSELPDEFHAMVKAMIDTFHLEFDHIMNHVNTRYDTLLNSLPEDFSRKDFALAVRDDRYKSMLFNRLDNQEERLVESVWKAIEPTGG